MLSDRPSGDPVGRATAEDLERVQVDAGSPEGHHAHLLHAKMAGRMPGSAGEVSQSNPTFHNWLRFEDSYKKKFNVNCSRVNIAL